jgi:hypothetical protein
MAPRSASEKELLFVPFSLRVSKKYYVKYLITINDILLRDVICYFPLENKMATGCAEEYFVIFLRFESI